MYLRERGRGGCKLFLIAVNFPLTDGLQERLLAPTERPAVIVRRRLEHAGYDTADGLENLGADEIQFLLKFVFKSERLGGDRVSHCIILSPSGAYVSFS
jgi:hypothetical protein